MFRANEWLALASLTALAGGSLAADPAPIPSPVLAGSHSIVSALPLPPGEDFGPVLSAPIIVNGYLVYPTSRQAHTLPDKGKAKGPVRMWWDYVRSPQHQCEPGGCDTPIGAGSFWTEWKFAYGSSRQYLGSAESAPVYRQFFNPDLEPGYLWRAWHPKKYGYVR